MDYGAVWVAAIPFVGVLLGLLMRTGLPLLDAILNKMKGTGEWPTFERKYLVPPLAAFLLNLLAFLVTLLTSPGFFGEIGALGFVVAVLVGYGGQGFVRDMQKITGTVSRLTDSEKDKITSTVFPRRNQKD